MKKERASISISKGVTFIELLIIVGILAILAAISIPAFRYFQRESDLDNSTEEIINTLRLAQSKTLGSEGASQYGVYFDNSTDPDQYTLFAGSSYSSLVDEIEIHKIAKTVEIYEIDLQGGQETVFDRLTGTTNQFGHISLRLKSDTSKTKIIYIGNSGKIGLSAPEIPSDTERIKDSRHVHFDYNIRTIDTLSEKLTLTFTYDSSSVTKEIIIADNMKDGQIYWEGEVAVNGVNQKIKIHTHSLNDPDTYTQFCVHRDRRYNDKALTITLSGDVSGNLIQYTADGSSTTFTSLYVSNLLWQ